MCWLGRWKISFGRSDQTEVERTRSDFRTDIVIATVERCELARDTIRRSVNEIRIYEAVKEGKRISKIYYKVIRIGYRFCSYIYRQR